VSRAGLSRGRGGIPASFCFRATVEVPMTALPAGGSQFVRWPQAAAGKISRGNCGEF